MFIQGYTARPPAINPQPDHSSTGQHQITMKNANFKLVENGGVLQVSILIFRN